MSHIDQKVDALKSILKGNTPDKKLQFQGGVTADKITEVKIGDTWTDSDGKVWEKTSYGKTSVTKTQAARTPLFCPQCGGVMAGSANSKIWYIKGKCIKCVTDEETQMRIDGTWKQYERTILEDRIRGHVRELRSGMEEYIEETLNAQFVQEDGEIEQWSTTQTAASLRTKLEVEINEYECKVLAQLDQDYPAQ